MSTDTLELFDLDVDLNASVPCEFVVLTCGSPAQYLLFARIALGCKSKTVGKYCAEHKDFLLDGQILHGHVLCNPFKCTGDHKCYITRVEAI